MELEEKMQLSLEHVGQQYPRPRKAGGAFD